MVFPALSVLPGDHDILSVTFGQNLAIIRKARPGRQGAGRSARGFGRT